MTTPDFTILLVSSDARRRYAEDILGVLATPTGGVIQFRYQAPYVAPDVQQIIRSREIIGRTGCVAFKSAADDDYFLPIRLVKILDVETVADVYVFKFRTSQYASLAEYPVDVAGIETVSRDYLRRLREMNGNQYYPAVTKFGRLPSVDFSDNDGDAWSSIARRLALHPTYASSYFLRLDRPQRVRAQGAILFQDDGVLRLTEERPISLTAHFYADAADSSTRQIVCTTDAAFLRLASSAEHAILSRYDSVEFWLQPALVNFATFSRVILAVSSDNPGELTTQVSFSVVVERAKGQVAARAVLGAIGAFLLALPAILGPQSDLALRAVLGVLGALIVSYVTVIMSAGRK